jgi:hypothetical protein
MVVQSEAWLSYFLVVENEGDPIAKTVKESAKLNGICVSFKYEATSEGYKCSLFMDDTLFVIATGKNKPQAKHRANRQAYELLKYYPKIKVKKTKRSCSIFKNPQMCTDTQLSGALAHFISDFHTDELCFNADFTPEEHAKIQALAFPINVILRTFAYEDGITTASRVGKAINYINLYYYLLEHGEKNEKYSLTLPPTE